MGVYEPRAGGLEIVTVTAGPSVEWARQLFREYAASLPFDLAFQSFADELASLPGDYIAPDGLLLLALVDGLPVGCVALHRWDDRHAEIKRLYVQPTCRGLGVGRALVGEVLAAARAAGYRAVLLDTTPTMVEAQQLYRSVGFVETGSYRHNPVPGTRYMRLELPEETDARGCS